MLPYGPFSVRDREGQIGRDIEKKKLENQQSVTITNKPASSQKKKEEEKGEDLFGDDDIDVDVRMDEMRVCAALHRALYPHQTVFLSNQREHE